MSSSSGLGIGDLGAAYGVKKSSEVKLKHGDNEDKTTLDMQDFLELMMVSLKNQSIDDTADTGEMMNQMVQMSVIQAIDDISTLISDSTTLNYAASLVGKDVTIGLWEGSELKEIEGKVAGTGTLSGQQVIFLEGDETAYYLTDIMGVGKLPEKITVQGEEKTEEDENKDPEQTENPGGTQDPDETQDPIQNPVEQAEQSPLVDEEQYPAEHEE